MRIFRGWAAILLLTGALSACGSRDPELEGSIVAQHATLSTEIANRRQTATLGAEQIRVTSEALSTQIRGATDRQQAIVRTLEGVGVMVIGLDLITPAVQAVTPRPGEQNIENSSASGGITLIAPTSAAAQAQSTPIVTATTRVNTPPTTNPAAPNLSQVSVSSSVGSNDCATGAASQFSTSTPQLYAVGIANNFPAGISVTFNWLRGQELVYSDSFTWELAVDDVCIWYFVTSEDFAFLSGNYTVTFESDGSPIAPSVNFVLTD